MKRIRTARLLIVVGLGLAQHAGFAAGETKWPATEGAAFALRSTEIGAPLVAFDTKGRDLMAFQCATRGRSLFGRFYELVCDGGSFIARDAGPWVGAQVATSGAFTIEVTMTPAEAAPKTRGVVLAYGNEQGEDMALLQDTTGLALRWGGGQPVALFAVEAGKPVHVLLACDKGSWTAYRDGKAAGSGTPTAGKPAWGNREILMGSAWSGGEAWRGRLEGIAIFPRALSAQEAAGEAEAIRSLNASRKPAPAIRFRGALARQARTSDLAEIRPYTRSLTAAEYKVEAVLSGEWKEPTITVLHWMIMDGSRLPIADRKPGAKVELTVERLEDHPQLESSRRDEIESDTVADLFYCESEP